MWRIRPRRTAEVLANAATNYVDSDAWRADVALQLLVDAGTVVDRARAIRAAQPPPWVIGIGDAVPGARSVGSVAVDRTWRSADRQSMGCLQALDVHQRSSCLMPDRVTE
jgi:hypothetical protein